MTDAETTFADRLTERRRSSSTVPAPDFGPASIEPETANLNRTVNDPSRSMADRLQARRQLSEMGQIQTDPILTDLERRREFLAGQVGQESLGEPGMQDLRVRADLGLSDTFEEQRTKFLDKFPDGDFVFVPRIPSDVTSRAFQGATILFRRTPGEQFAELDAQILESTEVLGDIADMAGEAPGMVAEGVAAVLTRGGSVVRSLIAMFAANLGGELLKEGVEELRGFQLESVGQVVSRGVLEAGIAAAAGGIMETLVGGPLNFARGSAMLTLRPGAESAQASAAALGMDRLLPTQVANSPIIRKIGNQLAGTIQTVNDWVVRQHNQAVSALTRLRRPDLARLLTDDPDVLGELHQEAIDQVVLAARRSDPSLSMTGTQVGVGIVEYDELASTVVNRAYTNARNTGTPEFDIAPADAVAREVLEGVQGRTAAGGVQRLDPIDPRLEAIAKQIRGSDPDLPTMNAGTINAADSVAQLRAWRSQLWELKTPNPGELFRQDHRQAARLFNAVDSVLRNPANADPVFTAAWRAANNLARGRFDTLEKLIIVEAGRTETPALLARKLIQPDQVDNLTLLRETIQEGPDGIARWGQFQEGARAFFLQDRNVHNLNNLLDTFDNETLNVLMNRAEVRDLRRIAGQVEVIDRIDLPGIAARQSDAASAIREALRSGNTRQVQDLTNIVKSLNPDDARRLDIRAGLIENIYNDVIDTELGFNVVNADRLNSVLSELRRADAIDLLTPNDVRVLERLDEVVPFLPSRGDMGASLEAASVAAAGRGLPRAVVTGDVSSILAFTGEMIELVGLGRMFTSETFQKIALGRSGGAVPRRAFTSLRIFGAILGDVSQNLGVVEPQE